MADDENPSREKMRKIRKTLDGHFDEDNDGFSTDHGYYGAFYVYFPSTKTEHTDSVRVEPEQSGAGCCVKLPNDQELKRYDFPKDLDDVANDIYTDIVTWREQGFPKIK